MQASLETISSLERKLSVTLPLEEVNSEIENRLKRLARTAKVHGFRPGKVPMRIVEQQYGGQVRQEVLGDAVQKSFGEAVRENNLRVAGFPRIELKSAGDASDKLEYEATFEVYPEVRVTEISGVTIERPTVDIGETEIDKTLEVLRKQRTVFEPADRAVETGDQIQLDYAGKIDGEPFEGGSGEGVHVRLGEARLLPEFEKQVIGMKAGDSRTFDITFPDDYHGKEVAGKIATFEVTVSEVQAPRLPEVDAEFAKNLGVGDGDIGKMRSEIRANLEREVQRRTSTRVKDQVMKALYDNVAVELPGSLVEMEVGRLMQGMRDDLTARGLKSDQIPLPKEAFEEDARRRVKLGLVVAELVRVENLQARPEQVKGVVEEFARSYEKPEEVVRWYYQNPERLREVESIVLEDNVVQWVLGKAKVEEKHTPFDELMGDAK
ncbi:MAG TPA: trigger factor [Burkholderiales bacterium]|nr:trigger factor [Burkholderiales bacterium]